ncbi:MAG: hypothetical protein LBO04_06760 [Spirochaetaceae bacterium]|nr:hypothetical protein [Spirochaetaceae bacterium]
MSPATTRSLIGALPVTGPASLVFVRLFEVRVLYLIFIEVGKSSPLVTIKASGSADTVAVPLPFFAIIHYNR